MSFSESLMLYAIRKRLMQDHLLLYAVTLNVKRVYLSNRHIMSAGFKKKFIIRD